MRHLSIPRLIQGSPTWVPLRLQALLPTSANSSRMKPRSGQRWLSQRASSRTEPRDTFQNVSFGECRLCETTNIKAGSTSRNGREQMQQRVVLFNYFVGAGEQRGAEGRERRDQLFSSRLSSLKKRQSVPCELILLGVDLIMPDSCFLGGARPAEVEISASHDPHPHAENSESRGRTRDRLRLPWSK